MKKVISLAATMAITVVATAQVKLGPDNIDKVLDAMTLEEKASLLVGGGWGSMLAGSGGGIPTGNQTALVAGSAGITHDIPRLGIPNTVVADGPAGLRISPMRTDTDKTFYCTAFPVGTVLACTWDTELVENLISYMGNEVKEYGVDVLLGPGQNIHRNPLNGRNFEYFSEDPILSGKIAAAYVRGIQSNGVGVSAKHFAANSQETNRYGDDVRINPRALREIYLRNFEIMVKESDPWTIMSSYNKINGEFTQESRDLLTTILRDEWGYKGIVMTDWTSVRNTAAQVHAGNDLMEPGYDAQEKAIVDAVNDGSLSIDDVNTCVRRILEYIVKTPRFNGYKYSDKPDLDLHAQKVREAASQGMVLLKNKNNALPFKNINSVALFGVQGYRTISGGTGSGQVNKPYMRHISEGLESAGIKLDQSIASYYDNCIKAFDIESSMKPAAGSLNSLLLTHLPTEPTLSSDMIKASCEANDAAIIVIGRNAGEGNDRLVAEDFTLTDNERATINNICDIYHVAGKKVFVVLNIGGVIETASWKSQPDAILLAWTAGQETGNSVADVLTGKVNPSGKLSMTFPLNYFDIPSSYNFPYEGEKEAPVMDAATAELMASFGVGVSGSQIKDQDYTNYEEGIWVGYRYFQTAGEEVSYPFGFGLSYTTFEYGNPVFKVEKDGSISASITVKNTGKVAGKEAVQMYVSAPEGGLVKPESELKAFAKTKELQPGESQTLTMSVSNYYLSSFNEQTSAYETPAGTYTIKIGASVEDIRAKGTVNMKTAQNYPASRALLPSEPVKEITVK